MGIQAAAEMISARTMAMVQSEVGTKVFRLALDSEASSAAALLNSANQTAGVGQNLNLLG